MCTYVSNSIQVTNGQTDGRKHASLTPSVRPFVHSFVCFFVRSICQGSPSYGGTNRDTSQKFKGNNKTGSTNKYMKFGQLIIRKIIKILSIRGHILRLQCTKFYPRRLSISSSLRWSLTLYIRLLKDVSNRAMHIERIQVYDTNKHCGNACVL